ncbi:hypothetical protein RJT34_33315 [Clitoria ternatea]|uniref:Uncharacterized protein n=1 Tax=Clitoria ternatea TaxID=43366 RepID=A0AAN9EXZ8_CLITE
MGLWNEEEDRVLSNYVKEHGTSKWNRIAKATGLKRSGKSCRLRWMNYLNPNVKHGNFSEEEQDLLIRLHKLLGNRWSLIAGRIPGRTDNQVKNYWNTHLSKKVCASPKCTRHLESIGGEGEANFTGMYEGVMTDDFWSSAFGFGDCDLNLCTPNYLTHSFDQECVFAL